MMLRTIWVEHVNNEEASSKIRAKWTFIIPIRNRHLKFLIEDKRDRETQYITYLESLSKWTIEQSLGDITKKKT